MAKKKRAKAATRKAKPKRVAKKRKRATRRRTKPTTRAKKRVPKKKSRKRRGRATGRTLVKQVERSSVERVMAGKRRRRSAPRKRRRVVMAGTTRRRSVGKKSGKGLLIGLAVGAAALYLLTRKSTPTNPGNYSNLPPLTQTQNYNRNTQTNNILQYAMAGGLAIDAIIRLIDRLNSSNDNEIQNIYDHVNTTGDVGVYV